MSKSVINVFKLAQKKPQFRGKKKQPIEIEIKNIQDLKNVSIEKIFWYLDDILSEPRKYNIVDNADIDAVNNLMNNFPWSLLHDFFTEYNEMIIRRNAISLAAFYLNFSQTPQTWRAIEKTRKLILARTVNVFPTKTQVLSIREKLGENPIVPFVSKQVMREKLISSIDEKLAQEKQHVSTIQKPLANLTDKEIEQVFFQEFGPPAEKSIAKQSSIEESSRESIVPVETIPGKRAILAIKALPQSSVLAIEDSPQSAERGLVPLVRSTENRETTIQATKKKLFEEREFVPLGISSEKTSPSTQKSFSRNVEKKIFQEAVLPVCESEYKRAPWLKESIGLKKRVKGFVISSSFPQFEKYATPSSIKTADQTKWFIVKKTWYSDVCKNLTRPFHENTIGYLLADDSIIVETRDLFDRAHKWLNKEKQLISTSLDSGPQLMRAAFDFLREKSRIIAGKTAAFTIKILSSLNFTSIVSLGDDLAQIITFLNPILTIPHLHSKRVERNQYDPEDLIKLTKRALLSEVYENPNAYVSDGKTTIKDVVEKNLELRRQKIKTLFEYYLINYNAPNKDRRVEPEAPIQQVRIDIPVQCKLKNDDAVYYLENGQMFCFDKEAISNISYNPATNVPFSKEFLSNLALLKNNPEQQISVYVKPQVEMNLVKRVIVELAPGLIDVMKKLLFEARVVTCQDCQTELLGPRYKTLLTTGEVVAFCSEKCFKTKKIK